MTRSLMTLIIVLAAGCAASAGEIADLHRKTAKADPNRRDECRSHDEADAKHHGVTEIGLERSGCYGTCPVYTVIIKSDGTFRYKGEHFVKRTGEHTGTVSLYAFNHVAQYVRDSGFMDLQESYTRMVTDNPTTFTTAVIDGKRKVVSNYADAGPSKLWAIEQLIDKLLLEAKWDESK